MKSAIPFNVKTVINDYFVAFWTVGIASLATLLLSPLIETSFFSLFLLAVMFSAWRKGLGAGILATVLSAFTSALVFIPPAFSLEINSNDFYKLIVFSFSAVVIGSLSASRKRAEEEQKRLLNETQIARIEAENANTVKDEFLAAVSHELRTPLTTIKILTRVLQRREVSSKEQNQYLKDIASECDRQIDLVHNLLDLSRIKSGGLQIETQFIDVGEVIRACERVERIQANENEHKIIVELFPDLHFIRADHSALRRALCTIIENAIKFTSRGGQITLRAYNEEQQVVIEVIDTGRGISNEDLPYIFDKFYRGHLNNQVNETRSDESEVPGIGLGLNLARALISGMNGTIEVKSQVGQGSTFTVRLPIWRERNSPNENGVMFKGTDSVHEILQPKRRGEING